MAAISKYQKLMKQYEDALNLIHRQQTMNQELLEERNILLMHNQILKETIAFLEGKSNGVSQIH